jgi:outer membrane protein TolC
MDDRVALVNLPPLPSAGIPSDLLQVRPDIRSAQRRVASADHRIAEAVADRYPVLRLSGEVSLLTQKSDFISQALTPLWNLVAGLTAPIFDGNRRAAEVDRRDAVLAERVSVYGQTVLTALMEVENALVQERQQSLYIEQLTLQLEAAHAAVEQSRERYEGGLTDFLPVLTATSAAQVNEQTLLDAKRQLLSFRIQLCRALGGRWTTQLEAPSLVHENEDAS